MEQLGPGDPAPFDAQDLVVTLAEVLRHQDRLEDASLLESAQATLARTGHDGWNGGVDFYTLHLEVPSAAYAQMEPGLDSAEQRLLERFRHLTRSVDGARIEAVLVSPRRTSFRSQPSPGRPSRAAPEIDRLWATGQFRLFLSHVSGCQESAHALKASLVRFSIAAFVAHEDVAPTLPWQDEIERALSSMDALAALVTPGFRTSGWCDQEVGFALGSGRLVVPIRLGADPHGFIGRHQGVQGMGKTSDQLAESLFGVLLNREQSSRRLVDVLTTRVEEAQSWSTSKETLSLLEKASRLDEATLVRLERAVESNPEVAEAFGVPRRIEMLCRRHRARSMQP